MVEALESVIAQFVDNDGVESGPPLQLPSGATPEQLALLLNHLLKNEDDKVPFVFSLGEIDIVSSLSEAMLKAGLSVESAISIVYSPQAVFKVRTVSRCTSSLTGTKYFMQDIQRLFYPSASVQMEKVLLPRPGTPL